MLACLFSLSAEAYIFKPDIDNEVRNFYDSPSNSRREKEKIVLDLMRKHARSWLIKVALGGIIIVFIFWYGWSGPRESTHDYAAEVNGVIISRDLLFSMLKAEEENIRMRYRGKIPAGLLEKIDLKKKILDKLIDQVLLLQEADRLGFFVTDEDLIYDIENDRRFFRGGFFDKNIYLAYARQLKLDSAGYEHARRQELLEERIRRLLTDGVKFDPSEIKEFWHFQNDKLVLSMLLLKPDQFVKDISIDNKSFEAYFKKNQKKYEIPRSVDLEYVVFSWRDLEKKMKTTEKEARTYFDNNPKEFIVPEKIRARHIFLKKPEDFTREKMEKVRKKIEAIHSRIKAGEDFAEVAKKESQDEATASKGGDLGFLVRKTMSHDFEDAAFKLEVGEVSDPVRTDRGYHLIRVDQRIPEKQIKFDDVKDNIIEKINARKARRKINEVSDAFYEKVYREEELQGPAKEFGFDMKKAEAVTGSAGIPELGGDPKVMEDLFQLQTGEISRLIHSGDSFIVMKVLKNTKARLPALDEVRQTVEKDYVKHQATVKARKKAEEILAALKKNPDNYEALAGNFGLKWEKMDPIPRTAGLVPRLGVAPEVREMLATVCKAAPLFPSPVPVPEGIAVFRLTAIEAASNEKFAKEAKRFETWIESVRTTEYVNGWLKLLKDRSQIKVNEKIL